MATDPGDALAEAQVARGDLEGVLLLELDGCGVAAGALSAAAACAEGVGGGEDVGGGVEGRAHGAAAVRLVGALHECLHHLARGERRSRHGEHGRVGSG